MNVCIRVCVCVCVACSRLGMQEVILVDCDVVAMSNLNRQVLFSKEDVGRRKVDAAQDGLRQHNIRTSTVRIWHHMIIT